MEVDLCRLCLQKNILVKVFCDEIVIEKIRNCCDLKIDHFDILPNYICNTCSDKLNSIMNFKKTCQVNDTYLREKYVMKIDVKIEPEEIFIPDFLPTKLETNSDDDYYKDILDPFIDHADSDVDLLIEYAKSNKIDESPFVNNCMKVKKKTKNKKDTKNTEQSSKHKKTSSNTLKKPSRSNVHPCNMCRRMKCNNKYRMVNNNLNDERYQHMANDSEGNERYRCKYCKVKCNSKLCHQVHVKMHAFEKVKKIERPGSNCPICGIYLDAKKYDSHLKTHDPQPYVCDFCEKKFSSKVCMRNHIEAHTRIRSRQCNYCGKILKNNETLQCHIKTHLLSYVVRCNQCGKSVKKSSLKNHMLIHTGEKKFQCDICKQRFISKTCVSSHMIIHTGNKPFECKYCCTKFASSKTLADHQKLHTGETPHHCPVCNKGFIQISNMKSHFRNNHKGVEYVYKSQVKLKRESMLVMKL